MSSRLVRAFEPSGESLAGVRIFQSLAAGERDSIARLCQGRRIAEGYEVIHDRDETNDVYFIVSGKVRATMVAPSGKEVSFRDLVSGDVFGDLSAIDGGPRSASIVALDESVVLSMRSASFWQVLETHPSVRAAQLRELTRLVRSLSERVVEYSTLGVKNRIHAELLRLAQPTDDGREARIRPVPTHAEIASRISTHREAVTRELGHLATIGLLERDHGTLLVRDLPRLQRMVHDVKGA